MPTTKCVLLAEHGANEKKNKVAKPKTELDRLTTPSNQCRLPEPEAEITNTSDRFFDIICPQTDIICGQ